MGDRTQTGTDTREARHREGETRRDAAPRNPLGTDGIPASRTASARPAAPSAPDAHAPPPPLAAPDPPRLGLPWGPVRRRSRGFAGSALQIAVSWSRTCPGQVTQTLCLHVLPVKQGLKGTSCSCCGLKWYLLRVPAVPGGLRTHQPWLSLILAWELLHARGTAEKERKKLIN